MRRINLYLPEQLIDQLTLYAESQGETFSSLTRTILSDFAAHATSKDGQEGATTPRLPFLKQAGPEEPEAMDGMHPGTVLNEDELVEIHSKLDLLLYYARKKRR
jgi:hypothetical protein